MYTIFFNFWRKASVLFAIGSLLFVYTTLPDSIAYVHNEFGRPIGYTDKQHFFYVAGGILILFNFLFGIGKNFFGNFDYARLIPSSLWAKAKDQLNDLISGWFNAFMAITNSLLVFVFLGLNAINRNSDQALDRNYNWFLILIVALLMVLVFYLPIKLLYTNPKDSE